VTLPIQRVTVHRDGALIVRRGTVTATEGIARVRGLPLLLDQGSVRTTVTGATVGGVRLELDVEGLERADKTEVAEALAVAQAEFSVLNAELGALQHQRKWLAAAAPRLGDDDDPPAPEQLLQWARLGEKIDPWARELDERIAKVTEKKKAARERVRSCQHDVEWSSTESWWKRWAPTRVAEIEVGIDGDIDVEISYRISGATWTPAYSLEADGPLRTGRFTMRALVVQATGEDWEGVQLALSTAPCARRLELPELPALRLGARQSQRRKAWRPLPADLDSLFPDDLEYVEVASGAYDDFIEDDITAEEEPDESWDLGDEMTPPPPAQAAAFPGAVSAPAPMSIASQSMPVARKSRSFLPSLPNLGGLGGGRSEGLYDTKTAVYSAGSLSPPPAPPPTPVPNRQDYPGFRLADHTRPAGERGRLYPISRDAWLAESGIPPAGARHVGHVFGQLTAACKKVPLTTLPPHHVLPGPVEGVDFRFDTDAAADVPSDGRLHSVAVFAEPVKLEAKYRTVPHEDPRVFRIVDAQIERSMPLLGGPVDVFVAGDLILTAAWKGTPGRGNIELGLGVEDALQIARNVRYDEQSTGIFGGGRRIDTSIEVTVSSGLAREVRLEILSRVPVPDDDDVTVEDLASEPKAKPWEGDPEGPILKGGRRQLVTVSPGGEIVTTLSYGVKIGAKDELIGGDRRG